MIKCIELSGVMHSLDSAVKELKMLHGMLEDNEVKINENSVKLRVFTDFYTGSSECCTDGRCDESKQNDHLVNQTQLRSLMEKDAAPDNA